MELRFNGLACRTNRGYPSEAELKVLLFENRQLARPTGAPAPNRFLPRHKGKNFF